jgi:large subunit ribosomal protein L30
MAEAKLKITQVRSKNHRSKNHQAVIAALGLGKMHKTVLRPDNLAVRGMVKELSYMVVVEEVKA